MVYAELNSLLQLLSNLLITNLQVFNWPLVIGSTSLRCEPTGTQRLSQCSGFDTTICTNSWYIGRWRRARLTTLVQDNSWSDMVYNGRVF